MDEILSRQLAFEKIIRERGVEVILHFRVDGQDQTRTERALPLDTASYAGVCKVRSEAMQSGQYVFLFHADTEDLSDMAHLRIEFDGSMFEAAGNEQGQTIFLDGLCYCREVLTTEQQT